MTNLGKNYQALHLVIIVFLILLGISFIPVEGELWGVELKQINLFSDLTYEEEEYEEDANFDWGTEEDIQEKNNDNIQEESDDSLSLNFSDKYVISLAGAGFSLDVTNHLLNFLDNENSKIDNFLTAPTQPKIKKEIEGNTAQMKYFFDALKKAKTSKVRIAHYGDSQIEGDLVTATLRETFRADFGGVGVGYLALTSQDVTFRSTTKHEYNESKWLTGSVFAGNEHNLPYGMGGESFIPEAGAWVSFKPTNRQKSTSKFKEAYLIYSDYKKGDLDYSIDNGAKESLKLVKSGDFEMATIKAGKSARSIKIEAPQKLDANLYGIFLEDGNGVYVDNYPLRGNSGEDLGKIPLKTLEAINKFREYNLVIFQFGKNAISGNYKRYEREMVKVIEGYKKAMPNTSFLMISVQDTGFKTSPRMLNLLKSQQNIAKEANIAFWNLFEAMGGKNSMAKWVKNNPPLASADHTHFNLTGAEIVGEMMAEAIIDLYNK